MDQMAHAFTVKRKSRRWPLVIFYNVLDLSTIAEIVICQTRMPTDKLSHDDNHQLSIIDAARGLVLHQVQRRESHPPQPSTSPLGRTWTQFLRLSAPAPQNKNQRKRPKIDAAAQSYKQEMFQLYNPINKRCSSCTTL